MSAALFLGLVNHTNNKIEDYKGYFHMRRNGGQGLLQPQHLGTGATWT